MRADCDVCRSEGLAARSQVLVTHGERHIHAILFQVEGEGMLALDEIGVSEAAWTLLGAADGDEVEVAHPPALESLADVRRRIYGNRLDGPALSGIVRDVVDGRYSDVHLSSFLTASASLPLDRQETVALTRAMVDVGDRLRWDVPIVMDKHCIGGLPGNRTTPIVVAIVAALGYRIPKTSSRAITSPAGTADTMEVMAPVALDLAAMRRVVEREGGCIVWGGNVRLSPADDILIRVQRPLDFDSDGQLVASVLSKKIAAGSTHVLIDMPVGPTAKVRGEAAAHSLGTRLGHTGAALGLHLGIHRTDGTQPVGRGIGPALEAHDVLKVLRNAADAPADLRERALALSAALLDMAPGSNAGTGLERARGVLDSGAALAKFLAICEAQGGFREPPRAAFTADVPAPASGRIAAIDNRRLAKLAKLAGAPTSPTAGLETGLRIGDTVERGQPMMTLHAESPGELAYALEHAATLQPFVLGEVP